jgi:hypothetical protein
MRSHTCTLNRQTAGNASLRRRRLDGWRGRRWVAGDLAEDGWKKEMIGNLFCKVYLGHFDFYNWVDMWGHFIPAN